MNDWADAADRELLDASLHELLDNEITAALAVADGDGARACTVYFASSAPDVWFTSQAATRHVGALRDRTAASLAIWARPEAWGGPLYGVQLFGSCAEAGSRAEAESGLSVLQGRFEGVADALARPEDVFGEARKTCLLHFRIQRGTLIDEARLGARRFVDFRAEGDQDA